MTKTIIKWTSISVFVFAILGFLIVYQEYKPLDTNGLSIEAVRSHNMVGDFIYPSASIGLPVIVFLGGSSGGLGNEAELMSLASNGFAVLSLAYFNEKGLPSKLENIPLEYFKNAFEWLKTKPQTDTGKLVLMGVSRGAELALLLASTYPQVKGVIGYAPGCFVLPNATEIESDTLTPSWTLGNNPVQFAPIKRFDENPNETINYKTYIAPLLLKDSTEEYMIKVEKINGPMLLFSGGKDLVWPAGTMATRIEERLAEKGFKHRFTNMIFEDGGHDLLMFKDCLPIISSVALKKIQLNIRGAEYQFNLGGTTFGTIKSKIRSRKLTIQFLNMIKNAK